MTTTTTRHEATHRRERPPTDAPDEVDFLGALGQEEGEARLGRAERVSGGGRSGQRGSHRERIRCSQSVGGLTGNRPAPCCHRAWAGRRWPCCFRVLGGSGMSRRSGPRLGTLLFLCGAEVWKPGPTAAQSGIAAAEGPPRRLIDRSVERSAGRPFGLQYRSGRPAANLQLFRSDYSNGREAAPKPQ